MRQAGFTLLEMLVALGLFALGAAIVLPNLARGFGPADLGSASQLVAAEMRRARNLALETRVETRFPMRPLELPGGVVMLVEPAEGIRFFPDGSSSGGRAALARGQATRLVEVDWLTGRVQAAGGS